MPPILGESNLMLKSMVILRDNIPQVYPPHEGTCNSDIPGLASRKLTYPTWGSLENHRLKYALLSRGIC